MGEKFKFGMYQVSCKHNDVEWRREKRKEGREIRILGDRDRIWALAPRKSHSLSHSAHHHAKDSNLKANQHASQKRFNINSS